jgi:hypothetical protein
MLLHACLLCNLCFSAHILYLKVRFTVYLCCSHSLSYSKVNVTWSSVFIFILFDCSKLFQLLLFCKLCNSKVYCGYHPWTGFQTIAIFMQTGEPERSVEVAVTISDVVVNSPNKVWLQNYLELIIYIHTFKCHAGIHQTRSFTTWLKNLILKKMHDYKLLWFSAVILPDLTITWLALQLYWHVS